MLRRYHKVRFKYDRVAFEQRLHDIQILEQVFPTFKQRLKQLTSRDLPKRRGRDRKNV
jgi:hypothetical protein